MLGTYTNYDKIHNIEGRYTPSIEICQSMFSGDTLRNYKK